MQALQLGQSPAPDANAAARGAKSQQQGALPNLHGQDGGVGSSLLKTLSSGCPSGPRGVDWREVLGFVLHKWTPRGGRNGSERRQCWITQGRGKPESPSNCSQDD